MHENAARIGKNLFKTIIHVNVRLKEATGFGQPICQYDRRSSGYQDYAGLAKEVHSLSKARAYGVRPKPAATTPLGPQIVKNGIKFNIKALGAKSVQVAGDFNNWNPKKGVLLDTEGQGIWSKVLPLEPGTYQYRFVVDGQWLADPQNPSKLESPFGGMNSVIKYRKRKETRRGEKP